MKKVFTLLVFAVFSLTATRAQQALDFTFTDTHGDTHNLQHALDQGFIVLLDFFFVNCPPCQGSAPELAAIANDYAGKNVILWSISDRDGNAAIEGFEETYGLNFPAGGTDGDGPAIVNLYANNFNFTGFPTISIICPDGSISWDIWPYSTGAPEWRNAIDACGVVDSAPYVSLNNTRVENIATVAQATLSPNPALAFSTLTLSLDEADMLQVELLNAQGSVVREIHNGMLQAGTHTLNVAVDNLPAAAYFVRLLNSNGQTRTLPLQKM